MDDEKLIELVRNWPCLYDKANVDFKDRNKKMRAWLDVAKNMGVDENSAMKRWGNLRERFSKEVRNARSTSGSAASVGRQWALFESLQFLRDHIIHRPMRQSIPVQNKFGDCEILDVSPELNVTVVHSPIQSFMKSPAMSEELREEDQSPQPVSSSSGATKRKRQLDELDSTILETVKTFQEVCARRARREEYSAEISGFGTMICGAISKMSASTQALVMRRCTEIVMQVQIDDCL